MTKGDFLAAYNIGHRDGKVDVYCPNDYDDIFDIEQQSCEDCCNGNQTEKAKLCQKSYIAGMEHNCENEEIIKVSKGVLKARQGRFVIYDVEWLKEHYNTTEAKIYGQPTKRTEERTEMHARDCISRKTGHWIEHKHGGIEHIECSECGVWFLKADLPRKSYCPNCGSCNGDMIKNIMRDITKK